MAASTNTPIPPRRTQQERREGTIRKLLDAATDALIEDGYAGASVQRICARADVSQGGLFRHFSTREALMVAAAEDVGQKLLDGYERAFLSSQVDAKKSEKRRGSVQRPEKKAAADPLVLALSLVRETCRSRLNQAWYELAIAARTSPVLQKALAPIAKRYFEKIEALGRVLLPDLAEALGPGFTAVIGTILALFDGEALHRFLLPDHPLEEARFEMLVLLSRTLVARTKGATTSDAESPSPEKSVRRSRRSRHPPR